MMIASLIASVVLAGGQLDAKNENQFEPAHVPTMLGKTVDFGTLEEQESEFLRFAWTKIKAQVPEPLRSRIDLDLKALENPQLQVQSADGSFQLDGVTLWKKPQLRSYSDLVRLLRSHGLLAPPNSFEPTSTSELAAQLRELVVHNSDARQQLINKLIIALFEEMKKTSPDVSLEEAKKRLVEAKELKSLAPYSTFKKIEDAIASTHASRFAEATDALRRELLAASGHIRDLSGQLPLGPDNTQMSPWNWERGSWLNMSHIEQRKSIVVVAKGSEILQGSTDPALRTMPQTSSLPDEQETEKLQLSNSHGLVLTNKGNVYSWSFEDWNRGNVGFTKVQFPKDHVKPSLDGDSAIVDIAVGPHQYLAIRAFRRFDSVSTSVIYGWGSNSSGMLNVFKPMEPVHFSQPTALGSLLYNGDVECFSSEASFIVTRTETTQGIPIEVEYDTFQSNKPKWLGKIPYEVFRNPGPNAPIGGIIFAAPLGWGLVAAASTNNAGKISLEYRLSNDADHRAPGRVVEASRQRVLIKTESGEVFALSLPSRLVAVDTRLGAGFPFEYEPSLFVAYNPPESSDGNLYRRYESHLGWSKFDDNTGSFLWPLPLGFRTYFGDDARAKDVLYSDHPIYREGFTTARSELRTIAENVLYLSMAVASGPSKLSAEKRQDDATLLDEHLMQMLEQTHYSALRETGFSTDQDLGGSLLKSWRERIQESLKQGSGTDISTPKLNSVAEDLRLSMSLLAESCVVSVDAGVFDRFLIALDSVRRSQFSEDTRAEILRDSILSQISASLSDDTNWATLREMMSRDDGKFPSEKELRTLVDLQSMILDDVQRAKESAIHSSALLQLEQSSLGEMSQFLSKGASKEISQLQTEVANLSVSLMRTSDPRVLPPRAIELIDRGRQTLMGLPGAMEFQSQRFATSPKELLEAGRKTIESIQKLRESGNVDAAALANLAMQSELYERARDSKYSSVLGLQLALAERVRGRNWDGKVWDLHAKGVDATRQYLSGDLQGAAATMTSAVQRLVPRHTFAGKLLGGISGLFGGLGGGGGSTGMSNEDVVNAMIQDGNTTRQLIVDDGNRTRALLVEATNLLSSQMLEQHKQVMEGITELSKQNFDYYVDLKNSLQAVQGSLNAIQGQLAAIDKKLDTSIEIQLNVDSQGYRLAKKIAGGLQRAESQTPYAKLEEFFSLMDPQKAVVDLTNGLGERFALVSESQEGVSTEGLNAQLFMTPGRSERLQKLLPALPNDTWASMAKLPTRDGFAWQDLRRHDGLQISNNGTQDQQWFRLVSAEKGLASADNVITETFTLLNWWRILTLMDGGKPIDEAKLQLNLNQKLPYVEDMFKGADLMLRLCIAQERVLLGPGVPPSPRIRKLQSIQGFLLRDWFELHRKYTVRQEPKEGSHSALSQGRRAS